MTCKPGIVKCGYKVSNIVDDSKNISDKINLTNLKETGMVQYLYHSPSSELPIRDISEKQKPEPHIEIGAENYIAECYQSNIRKFAESDMKYLFLVTTCRNKNMNKKLNKKTGEKKTNQFIVGYIVKDPKLKSFYIHGHVCIRGRTYIYSFDDSILVKDIFGKNFAQSENKGKTKSLSRDVFVDNPKTEKILKHLEKGTNILSECIDEIKKLDTENKTCLVSRGGSCNFQNNGCLRWRLK